MNGNNNSNCLRAKGNKGMQVKMVTGGGERTRERKGLIEEVVSE